jgi:hypothetical protein
VALFSKKTDATSADSIPAEVAESDAITRRSYTPGKGKATPKRTEAQRRKAEPPPANRREALKRSREKARAERAEANAGRLAGDERYFLPRDKGPERALVRDLVDSRRTVGPYFFVGAFVLLILTMVPDYRIALLANAVWLALAAMMIVDTFFICRRVKKIVKERFPKTTEKMGSLYFYAGMRALSLRKLRLPKPRVNIGAKI